MLSNDGFWYRDSRTSNHTRLNSVQKQGLRATPKTTQTNLEPHQIEICFKRVSGAPLRQHKDKYVLSVNDECASSIDIIVFSEFLAS